MEFSIPVPRRNEILGQFANKWYDFVSRFQCHQDQSGISNTSFLLHYGSQTIKEVQLDKKISTEKFPTFISCLERLEIHCLFQIVLSFLRHLFFTHCQRAGSSVKEFYMELKMLSEWCSFDNNVCDGLIKNQLINNLYDKSARDVLVNVHSLTARNVVDVCSIAEKQGSGVNSDILNMYIMEQQHKSLSNLGMKSKKDCVWTASFQDIQSEINQGLNPSTIFRNDSHFDGVSDLRKTLTDFTTKHNNAYLNFNYSVTNQVSDSSVFTNKVAAIAVTYPQTTVIESSMTNFAPVFPQNANHIVPFQDPQHIKPAPVSTKESKKPNLKESPPKPLIKKPSNDISVSINSTSNNSNDDVSAAESINENTEDLLRCMLNPKSKSNNRNNRKRKNLSASSSCDSLKDDVNEVPLVFISHQKATLKTSQIVEATGQVIDVYSCNFCVFNCPGKSAIEEHAMQDHNSLKCFVCTACNSKFPSKDQIDSHVRVKHLNVEEHKCQICDMVFASQSKLFQHLQGHAETSTVSCVVCSAMFTTEKLLSEHMSNVHPAMDKWICRVCGAAFSLRKALSDHVSDSHKDKASVKILVSQRFNCKLCDIYFTDKRSSEMHKRKFHKNVRRKRYPCNICDQVSSSNANLISHMRIHTGEKPYMCEICGKEFSQSSSLDKHTRIHTGEKPYRCQYCDLSFNTSSNRLVHERNHRKERPYICEQCGKTYRNSYELKVHIDTHNEFRTKRFICHCGAAFDTKRKLKRHEVCHTGQKPYKCEICGAGFTRSENVKGHQKSQACRKRVSKLT